MEPAMQYPNESKKEPVLAFLLSMAVCANILEQCLPSIPFLPWLKPGLANAFTLSAIYLYGTAAGIMIAFLRTLISGAFAGIPVTSLLIGGSGGIVSAVVMGFLWQTLAKGQNISLIGIGIAGAFVHTLTQLVVVYFLFIQNTYVFWQIPIIGPLAAGTGTITGIIAISICFFIAGNVHRIGQQSVQSATAMGMTSFVKIFCMIVLSVLAFYIESPAYLLTGLGIALLVISLQGKISKIRIFLRFIPLVVISVLLNAFSEPGHYLTWFPFVTFEGIYKGVYLSARFWFLIAVSLLLVSKEDLVALLLLIKKAAPSLSQVMEIGVRGINSVPAVISVLKVFYQKSPKKGVSARIKYFNEGFSQALLAVIETI